MSLTFSSIKKEKKRKKKSAKNNQSRESESVITKKNYKWGEFTYLIKRRILSPKKRKKRKILYI